MLSLQHVMRPPAGSFGDFIARARTVGQLVVQPRMGFSDPSRMRAGLLAVRRVPAATAGTITLDSYTRVGDHAAARRALDDRADLNGYPIVAHDLSTTRAVLRGVQAAGFSVQVRHGSADPRAIVAALAGAGLTASEGGPVSYCLPYGRVPLRRSVDNWAESCQLLAGLVEQGLQPHLETFGGCLMGQLCPPSMLVAISVLEGMFFRQHGLRSISLSYAQQTSPAQDIESVLALRTLAVELLPDIDWHVVIYAYMGLYPRTPAGASRLLEQAAALAVRTESARLIVKTVAEAHRIPTIEENVAALRTAAAAAAAARYGPARSDAANGCYNQTYAEARALVDAVLDLDADIGRAFVRAFRRGYLDVPYCLHPDNAGRARSYLDSAGRLRWAELGALPIGHLVRADRRGRLSAAGLLASLSYVQRTFDARPTPAAPDHRNLSREHR